MNTLIQCTFVYSLRMARNCFGCLLFHLRMGPIAAVIPHTRDRGNLPASGKVSKCAVSFVSLCGEITLTRLKKQNLLVARYFVPNFIPQNNLQYHW